MLKGGIFVRKLFLTLLIKVLTETETKVVERGLHIAPIPKCINELELHRGLAELRRKMEIEWYFRNEINEDFSATPVFHPKSNWILPLSHTNLEGFLSEIEEELFENSHFSHFHQHNFS